ncbi:MAG: hypothetical protein K9J17_10240 [Flavobacteriales bacterium]|nr:hypothetical protein [Flavobacteriales bacterium]
MKSILQTTALLTLLVAIGCQQPCTTTTFNVNKYSGDTVFVKRAYAICGDTLNYYERQVTSDSIVVSEGEVLNGKKEGQWKTSGWNKTVSDYQHGIALRVEISNKEGVLEQEEVLGPDSLYKVKSFYEDGTLESEFFQTLDGLMTGRGIEYDKAGKKIAEGEYLTEWIIGDTMYIESPLPPYDLEMTIISDAGGKHGPWFYYDSNGNVTDTVKFNAGKAEWTGNLVGLWDSDSVATTYTAPSEKVLPMLAYGFEDFKGYEFTESGSLHARGKKGRLGRTMHYDWTHDNSYLEVTDQGDHLSLQIRRFDDTRLILILDDLTFYLRRAE